MPRSTRQSLVGVGIIFVMPVTRAACGPPRSRNNSAGREVVGRSRCGGLTHVTVGALVGAEAGLRAERREPAARHLSFMAQRKLGKEFCCRPNFTSATVASCPGGGVG